MMCLRLIRKRMKHPTRHSVHPKVRAINKHTGYGKVWKRNLLTYLIFWLRIIIMELGYITRIFYQRIFYDNPH